MTKVRGGNTSTIDGPMYRMRAHDQMHGQHGAFSPGSSGDRIGARVSGVLLVDRPSCEVPSGQTITLEEWRRQNA